MDPYGYSKLDDIRNEIRLVTLLPGNAHEPIKIKLTVLSLVDEDRSPRRTLSLSHVQAHTPSTWIARETLEGRILYESSTTDDTTWTHPDPGFDHKGTDRWPVVRKNPPYEALSYVWGPSDDPISLSVREDDGLKTLHVRRNLFSALIHLRDPEQPNALWIDALCINQEDLAERSAQVLRIPDIYSFASRVIVWLGPAEKTTNLALSSMEYIGMQVETTADHCVVRSPDHIEPNWFSPKVNISYEPVKWTAIENLLDRSWFERFWVRQEVQLANEQSVIRCGSDEILWYHFRRALICLWCKLEIKDQPKLIMQLRSVGQLGEDWTQYDLIRLFRVTCELQCMDPRDKVYGLLGLAPFWFRERIKPRYDLSVGEVYKEAFLAYLQHTQRLDLLRYTFQSEMRVEGPSWVTDWCIPRAIDIAANGEFASGISRASYTLEGNVLSVMGLEFATVQSATEPAPENIDCILNFVRERWHPEDFRTGVYATGETMEDAFALTLCTNRTTSRFPTISSYIDPVHWKELLVNSQAATNASSLNALKRLSTKRLVTLENGYIGLGPTTVQAGKHFLSVSTLLPEDSNLELRRQARHTPRSKYTSTSPTSSIPVLYQIYSNRPMLRTRSHERRGTIRTASRTMDDSTSTRLHYSNLPKQRHGCIILG